MAELTRTGNYLRDQHKDKFKILEEAMYKSRGKANYAFFADMLYSDTVTADDIAKIANGFSDEALDKIKRDSTTDYLWVKNNRQRRRLVGNEKREWRDKLGKEYKFKDTFIYRAMENIGLSTKELVRELDMTANWGFRTRVYMEKEFHNTGDDVNFPFMVSKTYSVSDDRRVMDAIGSLTMYYHANKDLRKLIIEDDDLNLMFSTKANIRKNKGHAPYDVECNITDEDWRKFQIECLVQEFDWLAHAPEDIKKHIHENADGLIRQRSVWRFPLFSKMIWDKARVPFSDLSVELMREAYSVMEYVGIGVVWNSDKDENKHFDSPYGYNTSATLKKISSLMRRFVSDIKKGFDPIDAREIMVDDLNMFVQTKGRNMWKFYAIDGFVGDYENIMPKKKAATRKLTTKDLSSTSTTKLPTITSLDDLFNK